MIIFESKSSLQIIHICYLLAPSSLFFIYSFNFCWFFASLETYFSCLIRFLFLMMSRFYHSNLIFLSCPLRKLFFNTDQLISRTPFVSFNFENNDVSIDLEVFEKLCLKFSKIWQMHYSLVSLYLFSSVDINNFILINVFKYMWSIHQNSYCSNGCNDEEDIKL